MGNGNSTSSTDETQPSQLINENNDSTEFSAVNDRELRCMRRCLKKDQDVFILNNLMLCVQFFENYEREIIDIKSRSVSQREDDANAILSQSSKHILLPGALEDQISHHVKFASTRLPDCESTIEPLQPVRMFVVFGNVDVTEVAEKSNDTLADKTFYKMRLEPSSNYGYVRLRSLQAPTTPKEQIMECLETDLPFIAEDDDEIYDENEDMLDLRMEFDTRLISETKKRGIMMDGKPAFTQSMNDLNNVDGFNGETNVLGMGRTRSQTDLEILKRPDDLGYQEPSCSGISERRLSGPLKQCKQLKMRMQQRRGSIESVPRSSKSSGYKSGSSGRSSVIEIYSDYGYASTVSSNVSESSVSPSNLPVSSSEIPASCFKKFVLMRDGKVCSAKAKVKAKRREPWNPTDRRIRKAEECQNEELSYLRSRKFRRYFKDLFANRLAKPLGFEIEDDTDVTRQGATIHCYSMKVEKGNPTLIIPHEIVPSISAQLPECYSDWLNRSRRAILDSPNKNIWITKEKIENIEQLDCHIIPESYKPTKDTDPYHAVEWQLTFPAAERYLETCLTHSQAHVYMMALVLRKNFIRGTDASFGLTISHIRSQLFWLLEENHSSSTWPENRAGESLMELLKKLYSAVSQSQPYLADYFISKKNLFKDIPRQYLHLTQKQIRRIIENPVLYVIAAMKNVRYKPEFFPVLDYKRLYDLLTIDDRDLVALIRPDLKSIDRPMQNTQEEDSGNSEERFLRIGGLGDRVKTEKFGGHRNSLNKSDNPSQDLVVQITDECVELQGLRLTAVLNMFIEHFMKMAERCHQYGAMERKDLYLNQAQRLSTILQSQVYGKEDAKRYSDTITKLRYELSHFETQKDGPGTSGRNDNPTISVPLNEYFIDKPEDQESRLFVPDAGERNEYNVDQTCV